MLNQTLHEIMERVKLEHPKYGCVKIKIVFHDDRLANHKFTISEMTLHAKEIMKHQV
jgi:hypothetical protein